MGLALGKISMTCDLSRLIMADNGLCCWCRVLMEGTTVFKQIRKFSAYARKQKTSLAAIQKAYAIASRAADVCKHDGHPQYLISCTLLPMLVGKRYEVRMLPCGYSSHVSSEKVNEPCCVSHQTLTYLARSLQLVRWLEQ